MAKKRHSIFWGAVAALAALLAAAPALADSGTQAGPRVVEAWARLPLHFIENQGQVSDPVRLYVHGPGHALFFTPEGLTLVVPDTAGRPPAVVRLTPLGMSRNAALTAQDPQPGRVNYLLGRDPRNWRTDLPTYKAALYRGAYPGIDLKFYGRGAELEYDLILQPGATPDRAKFRVTGIRGLRLTPAGHLEMQLPGGGTLLQKKPVIYQELAGRRLPREGRFTVRPEDSGFAYGFEVAGHDPRHPLVIDPTIVFSSFLGGTNAETGAAIAVQTNIAGITNAYVTGQTSSFDFPQTAPKSIPATNAFVTKFNQNGNSLVFSTILGGSGTDVGTGIGVDDEGRAVVVGFTNSQNFPLRNAAQSRNRGGNDAFVTKLSAAGNSLVFSTFLGGSGDDKANAVAVHPDTNDAYVTGTTTSDNFRVRNALQPGKPGLPGTSNAFVARFRPGGGLNFSTYLGGSGEDSGNGIAAHRDAGGNDFVFITGTTNSFDFPIRNAFQPAPRGDTDAFVTKLNNRGKLPNDGTPVFSTFLGGQQADAGRAIAVHRDGGGNLLAFVTGDTTSFDFPIKNPFQGQQGGQDAFVTQFDSSGRNLVFSTFLGGRDDDQGLGIAVHGPGRATVTGVTSSFDFPIRNPIPGQGSINGDTDAFVTRFHENGNSLIFSTFLGGRDDDRGLGVAVDVAPPAPTHDAFVVGTTSSFDFPFRNPIQPTGANLQGGTDAFVTRIRE